MNTFETMPVDLIWPQPDDWQLVSSTRIDRLDDHAAKLKPSLLQISVRNTTIFPKWCQIGPRLLLITIRKSHTCFRLVPKFTTLVECERPLCFHYITHGFEKLPQKFESTLCLKQESPAVADKPAWCLEIGSRVIQGHRKWHYSIACVWFHSVL